MEITALGIWMLVAIEELAIVQYFATLELKYRNAGGGLNWPEQSVVIERDACFGVNLLKPFSRVRQ